LPRVPRAPTSCTAGGQEYDSSRLAALGVVHVSGTHQSTTASTSASSRTRFPTSAKAVAEILRCTPRSGASRSCSDHRSSGRLDRQPNLLAKSRSFCLERPSAAGVKNTFWPGQARWMAYSPHKGFAGPGSADHHRMPWLRHRSPLARKDRAGNRKEAAQGRHLSQGIPGEGGQVNPPRLGACGRSEQ